MLPEIPFTIESMFSIGFDCDGDGTPPTIPPVAKPGTPNLLKKSAPPALLCWFSFKITSPGLAN